MFIFAVDGNGLLHCHKFGLACHLGVLVGDTPFVGVAKNLYQMNEIGLLRCVLNSTCENPNLVAFIFEF